MTVGAKDPDQVRDLLRLQQAVNRCFSHHDLLHYLGLRDTMNPGLISNLLFDKRGSYIGWANCVAGDAMFCGFQSRHARETQQTMLGCDVRGLIRRRAQGMYRCNIDHSSPPSLVHTW